MIQSFNWDKVLSEIPADDVNEANRILAEKGVFTDEDGFAPAVMFKEAKPQLIGRLIKEGYAGGVLLIVGKYYTNYGQVLAVYDSDRFMDLKSVMDFLDNYVENRVSSC